MEFTGTLREVLIARTLRVPASEGPAGPGDPVTRQLDSTLLTVGFSCSQALLEHLAALHPAAVREAGESILRAVRALVGDHVRHNAYFKDFPDNVPDTMEFWARCIADALLDPRSAGNVAGQLASGYVNLLDLPRYGRYQHTYEELLAAHDELIATAADRITVLHLGGTLTDESHRLYLQLAGSAVPLSESDLALLGALAEVHAGDPQPDTIGIRENRAVINRIRVRHGLPLLVDTPVDVLRLACALSDGDVTLSTPTQFRSLRRAERRALLAALDGVVAASPAKLGDVPRHSEPFKRLGERLHPHEYPRWRGAQDVFAVARGELEARSLASRVEAALGADRPDDAVALLGRAAPGALVRSVDRLARAGADLGALTEAVHDAVPAVSTRVLLSLREHLLNRETQSRVRTFVNQQGRSWVTPDHREPLPTAVTATLGHVLDDALGARLPRIERLVVDPAVRSVAVPLSAKTRPGGLGILPRGSVAELGRHMRFFVYWKERGERTDYDLSVLLLDHDFIDVGQVSWTNLGLRGVVHSGDITEAPGGASEFIDLDLSSVTARYVVPQVNVYDGEGFDEIDEAFFGFMQREPGQHGRPFEPRTVRSKSDLVGAGWVALPVIFGRGDDGDWHATWMHVTLRGHPRFNRVEANRLSTSLLVRGIVERQYLHITYLEGLIRGAGATVEEWPADLDPGKPVTYVGLERPDGLPAGSTVFTPVNLPELFGSA